VRWADTSSLKGYSHMACQQAKIADLVVDLLFGNQFVPGIDRDLDVVTSPDAATETRSVTTPNNYYFIFMFLSIGVHYMPCCLTCGKAEGLQIQCCQGFSVGLLRLHPRRLGSEALRLLQR
ncbi:MAG: hypothetical protein R6U27_05700, partial [Desulfobacterales bacterium]